MVFYNSKNSYPNVALTNMDSGVYFSNPDFLINAKSHQSLDFISKSNLILFLLYNAGLYF